ncbi:MAG TPA: CBS domain-containing protein [Planctomycetota bacterium]|nr:CBS domain-containing protein [Planctomycetota bacterium]
MAREKQAATVAEVMTQVVVGLPTNATVADAIDLFTSRHITGAPIVSKEGEVQGLVSMTDALAASDKTCPVMDIAARRVVEIDEDAPLSEAAKVLLDLGIHRLLVTRRGRFAGILSSTDVLKWVARPALEAELR